MIHYIGSFVLCFAGSTTLLFAQLSDSTFLNSFHHEKFTVRRTDDTLFILANQFIFPGTESITLDSVKLRAGEDYFLDNRLGVLSIHSSVLSFISGNTSIYQLRVKYKSLPFKFKKSYYHREAVNIIDTVTGSRINVAKSTTPFLFDDLFGSGIQKSGSIVRGFTIGSNRDLSLNSGFRMQMSGRLTNDIDVIAALTDENSPIQPEGTTQTLQEVDKVFVELHSSNISGTLGDFNLNLSGNEFGLLDRKLQGVKGYANYQIDGIGGDVLAVGAVTRGKFITNQFEGLDGVQGPYLLVGENNNRSIIVVAGTERVYVNGERMNRGENSDYVIDYANSEVTFTPHRLISRGSRITVDFEYSDRQFNRSLYAVKSGVSLYKSKLILNSTFVSESDDENSLVDISLTDIDKKILNSAGDDRLKAVHSGVDSVGAGRGQYLGFDSLVSVPAGKDSLIRIFRFAPDDTVNAIYAVSFSFVGLGRGSYKKISLGHYAFIGIKQGSYEPIRLLPMPQKNSFLDFDLIGRPSDNLKLTGEYAVSNYDPNRFSSINDDQHRGSAVKFGLQYSPKNIKIGNADIGSFDVLLKERYVGRQFVPLDRMNEIEFNRKWNIVESTKVDEEIREGYLTYLPVQSIMMTGGIGWLKQGDLFSSNRTTISSRIEGERLPKIDYDLEVIKTRNSILDISGNWIRQRGGAQYTIGLITPQVHASNDVLTNKDLALDTMKAGSYRFTEIVPAVSFGDKNSIFATAELGWHWDDSLHEGSLQHTSKIFSQHYAAQLQDWNSLSSSVDFTTQNRKFTETFKQRNNSDAQTILLRWQSSYYPWNRGMETNLYYEVASERTAKQERVFQRVPKGTGNYIYLGDVNGNHIIDQQDFQFSRFDADYIAFAVPTDELVPVIDLKASMRVRFNLAKIFSPDGWIKKTIAKFSSETYYRVEEKSSEPDRRQIYLLHFSRFLSDETTIVGNNLFTHDFYFLEDNRDFSLRLRFTQRRGLTQYTLLSERAYLRERSVRLRWQLIPEISNQTDFIRKNDILSSSSINNRSRNVTSNSFITDWSYRPEQKIEVGFEFGFGQATNLGITSADLNDQSVRITYSFEEKGQARGEFAREEVILGSTERLIPFELTGGKIEGKTWLWRLSFDYKMTKFIQATISYDGRSEGERDAVHTGRAELRAFF